MMLTARWTPLRYHAVQRALWADTVRFKIAHAGRRSGKTEIAKRRLIKAALECTRSGGRFAFAAPTHRQAADIYWDDTQALVPAWAYMGGKARAVSESMKTIRLVNGAKIEIVGMDKPERIEGPPLDGIVCDEYGNMKEGTFEKHIRPALSTIDRPGWAWFIGAPEGRNHYWRLVEKMRDNPEWKVYCWKTADINPEEAKAAMSDMDIKTWQQEYEGMFVSFEGLAYYCFSRELNCPPSGSVTMYDPRLPLIICHDFNRIPGNAVIAQEQSPPLWLTQRNNGTPQDKVTVVLDEVFFETDSTTPKVGAEVCRRWAPLQPTEVRLYGDASGGAKTSQGVEGSDWDILEDVYKRAFPKVCAYYPKKNPPVRVRLNCTNSRLRSASGLISTVVDSRCKMLIRDFEGVTCNEAGELEKDEALLTHISDGFGYYAAEEHKFGHAFSQRDL